MNIYFRLFFVARTLKHAEVREKLMEKLYTVSSNNANLTCANNHNEAVPCPNGYCQLLQATETSFDRRCVEKGSGNNPGGLLAVSTIDEKFGNVSLLQYSCNKPMCNGMEAGNQVREILLAYQLVEKAALTPDNATLKPDNAAAKTSHQIIMMNLAWMSLWMMTRFFQ